MNKHEYTGERPFWYDGKMVNEVGFCEDFLQKHPMVRVGGSCQAPHRRCDFGFEGAEKAGVFSR